MLLVHNWKSSGVREQSLLWPALLVYVPQRSTREPPIDATSVLHDTSESVLSCETSLPFLSAQLLLIQLLLVYTVYQPIFFCSPATVSLYHSFPAFIPWFMPACSWTLAFLTFHLLLLCLDYCLPVADPCLLDPWLLDLCPLKTELKYWPVNKVKLCEPLLKCLQSCMWALPVQICEIPVPFDKQIHEGADLSDVATLHNDL